MIFVVNSFISSFFYYIIRFSIVSSIIGIVVLGIRYLFDKIIAPKYKYMIWLIFIVSILIPISIPSKISIYNYILLNNIIIDESEIPNSIMILSNRFDEGTEKKKCLIRNGCLNNNERLEKNFKTFFIYVWFIVFLLKILRLLIIYLIFNKQIVDDNCNEQRIVKILERCKKKLKIKRNIKIVEQHLTKSPAIVGIIDVKLLFNSSILELSDTELEYIIMHELSHYKRKDNITNFIILFLKCVYWFNPLTQYFCNCIKSDIELATDEMAIKNIRSEEKMNYCRTIVKVATMCSTKIESVVAFASDVRILEQRINMVSLKDEFQKNSKIICAFSIFIIILIALILFPSSYGINDIPKIYLKDENGNIAECIISTEEADYEKCNTIKLNQDSVLDIVCNNNNSVDYITYSIIDNNSYNDIVEDGRISLDGRFSHFQSGDYICKFTIESRNGNKVDYVVKFIVE